MAKQAAKISIATALGARGAKAFEASKNNEVQFDRGGELPVFNAGIAQLVSMSLGMYKEGPNKGKPFFRAAGVMLTPKTVTDADGNANPVAGLQTSIMIPLCDTKTQKGDVTKMEDHLEKLINEVKKLGVDLSEVGFDEFDSTFDALVETAPQFKVRTWASKPTKEYPTPRVNHVWNGLVGEDDTVSPDDDDAVQVDEPTVEDDTPADDADAAPADDAGGDDASAVDYEALLKVASKNAKTAEVKTAQATLRQAAIDAGNDGDVVDNADSWKDVYDMIMAAQGGDDAPPEDEPGLDVGSAVQYRPVDAKTKKPGKVVDCEITKVYKDGSFDLKNIADPKKVYTKVSADDVIA